MNDNQTSVWEDSEQIQCSTCKNSDFKIIEKETWWSKERPDLKNMIKRILMQCCRCGAKKQVFFPNLGWSLPITIN